MTTRKKITAVMAIHFWYVDDRYVTPKVRDVSFEDEDIFPFLIGDISIN